MKSYVLFRKRGRLAAHGPVLGIELGTTALNTAAYVYSVPDVHWENRRNA